MNQAPLSWPARLAIAVLALLGLLGGSLVVAQAGFSSRPPRGGASVFVPLPQAWLMAATMYLMAALALLALLRASRASPAACAGALGLAALAAWGLVWQWSAG